MQNFQELIKKRWTWSILPVLIFASLFSIGHSLLNFTILTLVLYIISLLFLYKRATWLVFFALSLLPTFATALMSQLNHQKMFSFAQTILFFVLFIIALLVSYWLARRKQIIKPLSYKEFPVLKIILGFVCLLLVSMVVNVISQQLHLVTTTDNQEALNSLATTIPFSVFAFQTVFAGFFEELTYRVGAFELLFKDHKILAFITATLLFTVMHGPTNIYSWLLYGCMSLVLTTFYFKYRNFYLNMSMHMLWNLLGISATFLIK